MSTTRSCTRAPCCQLALGNAKHRAKLPRSMTKEAPLFSPQGTAKIQFLTRKAYTEYMRIEVVIEQHTKNARIINKEY